MKLNRLLYILYFIGVLSFASCSFDNHDAPSCHFSGSLVYKGEAIGVGYNDINFELWEANPKWDIKAAIMVAVAPEGTYSAELFGGDYKLKIVKGQGPFLPLDTIPVKVNGTTKLDIEVTPFYMVRTPNFTVSARTVTGTFKVEQIVTDAALAKNIEFVGLFINKTVFVDMTQNNICSNKVSSIADLSAISLSVAVPTLLPTQNVVYARIGVKIAGVEDPIYSPVQQVTLQ